MNTTNNPALEHINITGHGLEFYWSRPRSDGEPVLVFLHEGLGSAALWSNFPVQLSARTGLPALVYSRYGYGGSDVLVGKRSVEYMHQEALEALPALREVLGLDDVILVGHSDGGSISLIHAGAGQWPVRALMLMAPHVFVEDVTIVGIKAAKVAYETTDLLTRIGHHHTDGDATFRGWNDIWLTPAFRDWNIEEFLPGVIAPALVLQGEGDEYGSGLQLEAIAAQTIGPCQTKVIPDCLHSPQRDQPEVTLARMADFLKGT
jgi:pimeloyl-ACP methyl ester carboxylesterase